MNNKSSNYLYARVLCFVAAILKIARKSLGAYLELLLFSVSDRILRQFASLNSSKLFVPDFALADRVLVYKARAIKLV